ncbi:hypothetical protein Ciccas_011728 [Cichlidogyrus casuarinus]|uniref:Adenylosuccinate lyase C-terminal domain-containing protein n=1 Tax=Cichlidogyrus casuarinus TaxID=1844966 RepID=A0ABD2PQE3_9PLAT
MVKAGANRQECHEMIRVHSQEAGKRVKLQGLENDLAQRLKNDPYFAPVKNDIDSLLQDPKHFIGLAPKQVQLFATEADHALQAYHDLLQQIQTVSLTV